MTGIVVAIVFAAAGAAVGRWWALWVAVACGLTPIAFGAATRSLVQLDTPIPFLAVLAGGAMAAGVFARRQFAPTV